MNSIKPPQVIVIASGKGGTGKSTLSINLSMALTELGKRVTLLDANLELPSIATLLNISPTYTLTDLIEGRCSIHEVIHCGPRGINFILGSTLPKPITNLGPAHHFGIVNAFNAIAEEMDILIVDTAPGINKSVFNFIRASQDILLVTRSEPTAIASTNALLNALHLDYNLQNFKILVNMTSNRYEGRAVFEKLLKMNMHMTDLFLNYAGYVLESTSARSAAIKGQALFSLYPKSEFAQDIRRLALTINRWPIRNTPTGDIEFFVESLIRNT
ncbi:P-loop NTPase [Pseudomonas sp. CCC3.1]|uniref:P-loop NTPase n=1 Tax=Pseudomonas sp. CCC3.1 TaxID=3048607 RepID=UPI002AC99D4F|nr:P-loop NTPase [Pseudomonas sp. CCC3.1]MEB0206809.1 P-loop NTPase [Pseudomonas sp. CCC3.1]WPX37569.1 P-loop NTPase [Pseudomonas sp. CCC3.1]